VEEEMVNVTSTLTLFKVHTHLQVIPERRHLITVLDGMEERFGRKVGGAKRFDGIRGWLIVFDADVQRAIQGGVVAGKQGFLHLNHQCVLIDFILVVIVVFIVVVVLILFFLCWRLG
jgi:hypothetical protein